MLRELLKVLRRRGVHVLRCVQVSELLVEVDLPVLLLSQEKRIEFGAEHLSLDRRNPLQESRRVPVDVR